MVLVWALLSLALRPAAASAQVALPAEEGHVLALINATRGGHGLQPIARSAVLDGLAQAQSSRMVEAGHIFHSPDLANALNATGLDWLRTGENVGVGPDIGDIHDAFIASPHHYENIVHVDFDRVGISMLSRPSGGVYVAQVFAQVTAPATQVAATATPVRRHPRSSALPSPVPTAAPSRPPISPPNAIEGGIVAPGPLFITPARLTAA